jgi:hypothetical protein
MLKPILASILFFTACTSDGESTSASHVTGDATYRDATTDHAGAAREPAAPSQSATVTVIVKGTATLPQVDARCAVDPAGLFEAHYASTVDFADGSAYLAAIGSGAITTPSGCELDALSGAIVTDVRIRAEIEATTQSCETYCQAYARAEAEQSCGATASAAACRSSAETSAEGTCTTTCTTRADHIVAETSLAAALFGDVDAEDLRAAALGDLEADLTFDHLTDANGERL